MGEAAWFRWLGVAGLELRVGERTLAIDPFVSRPPARRLVWGRAEPDRALVAEKLPRCDDILVTHAHWDHLMDVPAAAAHTGAEVYAPPNACQVLRVCGVPDPRIHPIAAGDHLRLGPFEIQVVAATHGTILGRTIFAGEVTRNLRPPLRLRDYRMDVDLSFLIEVAGLRLLDWSSERTDGKVAADVLFIKPLSAHTEFYAELVCAVRPSVVIPIHWDDFFRPLSKPQRPTIAPPACEMPPVRRVDLGRFRRLIERLAPDTTVLVPELFRPYDLRQRR